MLDDLKLPNLVKVKLKNLPPGDAYGESWEVSDHPSHASVVATGPQDRPRTPVTINKVTVLATPK